MRPRPGRTRPTLGLTSTTPGHTTLCVDMSALRTCPLGTNSISTHTYTHIQTHTDTDIQTGTHIHRDTNTHRHTDTQTHTDTHRHTDTDRHSHRHGHTQTDWQTYQPNHRVQHSPHHVSRCEASQLFGIPPHSQSRSHSPITQGTHPAPHAYPCNASLTRVSTSQRPRVILPSPRLAGPGVRVCVGVRVSE
jgi:hypothetical protein